MTPTHLETRLALFLSELSDTNYTGDLHTDYATRISASTDNSIHQRIPAAVLFPKNEKDVHSIVHLASQEKFRAISLCARGGGTAPNGQSLSAGIIIDFSRHMHRILEINPEEKWARVQPGVLLDQLNDHLKSFNLVFPIDISTSNRATLGGMVNTDACGIGAGRYGRTGDNVISLNVLTPDAHKLTTALHPLEEKLDLPLDAIRSLIIQNNDEIQRTFPHAPRTFSGYNLSKLLNKENVFNSNQIFCGSEGTLGLITECKLQLITPPKHKHLVVLQYRNLLEALEDNVFEKTTPDAIEVLDENIIKAAQNNTQLQDIVKLTGNTQPVALVLLELSGDSLSALNARSLSIKPLVNALNVHIAKTPSDIAYFWTLRKKSVGLISKKTDGTRRPIPFIEDTAVPLEHLTHYIKDIKTLLDKHELTYGMYGHLDAGCIHIRPALDLHNTEDQKLYQTLIMDVLDLVKSYGGVLWGEHGQGYRSKLSEELFPKNIQEIIRDIKTHFDPDNTFNPGKIAVARNHQLSLVRHTDDLRVNFDRNITPEAEKKYHTLLACNGNAACFDYSPANVMCPTFKTSGDRCQSPKGRAMLIREWLAHSDAAPENFDKEVFQALSTCVGCKACVSECPLGVDIPAHKSKFLATYHTTHRRKWRDFLLASMEELTPILSRAPRFFNLALKNPISSFVLRFVFSVVNLPRLSTEKTVVLKGDNTVFLLQDVLTSFYDNTVIAACNTVFESLGIHISTLPYRPSGKPAHNLGFIKKFNRRAQKNLVFLKKHLNATLFSIEPSIALCYRQEYKPHLTQDVFFVQELLFKFISKNKNTQPKKNKRAYFLLSHCSEQSCAPQSLEQWQAIFAHFGATLNIIRTSCCGMAGSFGHEKEHARFSKEMFENNWAAAIRPHTKTPQRLLSTGFSCRSQVKRCLNIKIRHPLQAIAEDLLQGENNVT